MNYIDSPDIFWKQPTLDPLYKVVRQYLEITQRYDITKSRTVLLNQRTKVITDLLKMLKDNLTNLHGEKVNRN